MKSLCQNRLKLCFLYLVFMTCCISLLPGMPAAQAKTRWEVFQNLKLPYSPVDLQVSADGGWLYVLSNKGDLMIYSSSGQLKDTIAVGPGVDRIKVGPQEGVLFLLDSKENTLQVVGISVVEDIDIKGSPVKGPSSAPVTIAVFSDFQCPYCARLESTLSQVVKHYPKQVKVVFKFFPLRSHSHALTAAKAALVAGNHGKFWEFHDQLFKNYRNLNDNKIDEIAVSLGLDPKKMKEEMKSPQVEERINADKKTGQEAGVRGTPTVFINGIALRDKSVRGFEIGISKALDELQKEAPKQ